MRHERRERDGDVVSALIAAVVRRRSWQHGALAVLVAVMLSSLLSASAPGLSTSALIGLGALAGGTVVAWGSRFRSRRTAAVAIEHVRPSCRNLVITAEELERHPERGSDAVKERIAADAAGVLDGLRPGRVVRMHTAVLALAASAAIVLLSLPAAREPVRDVVQELSSALALPGLTPDVRVTVTPPDYTGRPRTALTNPQRIEALEGSRIAFELPQGWGARFRQTTMSTELVARESGYFAIEPSPDGEPILIPLDVVPDRVPTVRIAAPAKDLLLPDGTRTIPVAISAADDLGLESLALLYTKVSGAGEQFEFAEGTLPVSVTRGSGREWMAEAQFRLASLQLGPGDSLVYRAVARDRRSGGSGLASSDTYFIEIMGPGQSAFEGVQMPPEMDRYAMSQQMIVLKLQRLRKNEPTMSPAGVAEEAASIAAEQRTVRGNFIFLLGGHVEDEEAEAAQSHEIQEGRLENSARKDIDAAISQMTRAEQALTAVDTAAALPPARAAADSLQRAFGRSRYLLRALSSNNRLDPSRRLTGDATAARNWRRDSGQPDVREGDSARALLMDLMEAAASGTPTPDRTELRRLAETALAIDPTSTVWQEIARSMLAAENAAALRPVIGRVASEAIRGSIRRTPLSIEMSPMERAFGMEGRR